MGISFAAMTTLMRDSSYAFLMLLPNSYAIIMNKNRDIGSRFLIPLEILKKPSKEPLMRREIFRVEMQLKIRLIH